MTSPYSAHSTTPFSASVEDRLALTPRVGTGQPMKRLAYELSDTLSKTASKHEEGGTPL